MQVVFTIGSGSGKDHELVEKLGGKHSGPFLCCERTGVAAKTRFVNTPESDIVCTGLIDQGANKTFTTLCKK